MNSALREIFDSQVGGKNDKMGKKGEPHVFLLGLGPPYFQYTLLYFIYRNAEFSVSRQNSHTEALQPKKAKRKLSS